MSLLLVGLLLGSIAIAMAPAIAPASKGDAGHPLASTAVSHPSAPTPAATHGDLIVSAANSPFIISPLTTGSGVYAQAGNITVLAGGTLIVTNETLRFYQYVPNTGNLGARLTHLYRFSVQGTVTFTNSTLTTDAQSINAFSKLTFNISAGGHVYLDHSSFAFPGALQVYGAGSFFNLSNSNLTSNLQVRGVVENLSLQHDTEFAPTVTVSGGARVMLANSAIDHYYANNLSHWGGPGPAPVNSNGLHVLNSGAGSTWSTWVTATDSENVSRAVLYPHVASGFIAFTYTTQVDQTVASGSSLTITSAVGLGSMTFPHSGTGYVRVPLPAGVISQINTIGIPAYLNATGNYATPGTISLTLGVTNSAAPLNITEASLNLSGAAQYDIVVSGAGTLFTAAASSLNLNWNLTQSSPYPPNTAPPTPWGSNKLDITNGAAAYLASVTIPSGRSGVFWNASAVQPDATSNAYLYRWLIVPVTGQGGLPIGGAQVTPFYSYDTNQLNNHTATTLNALSTANVDLYNYANAFDKANGITSYGLSSPAGQGWLLVASSWVNQSSLPNGIFLGGYHIGVSLPGAGAAGNQWVYSSVTPYPQGMNPAGPDTSTGVNYPSFGPAVAFANVNVTVQGVLSSPASASIGQTLKVTANVKNTGSGPVPSYIANLSYVNAFPPVGTYRVAPSQTFPVLPAGTSRPLNVSWLINQTVTGLHGWINTSLVLTVVWGGGHAPTGGLITETIPVTVQPSQIAVTIVAPKGTYLLQSETPVTGNVTFNGSGPATVLVTAVETGHYYPVAFAHQLPPGQYNASIMPDPTMTPGTYSLLVNASFNGRTTHIVLTNWMVLPGAAAASQPWYEQAFFGLPLWLWIVIAALVVVGGVGGFLVYSRYAARGKLVECGECGELIPESATVCPKCGAEFETGLVRCSRCNSTIPADSKVCPECSAQLLGAPEEGARDPERQGYADFVERYRAEAKKELQDNYTEGAFWDWWKRQPSYVPFNQWRLQQSQGSRIGMSAPPTDAMMAQQAAVAAPVAPAAPAAARVAPTPAARAPRVAPAAPAAPAPTPPTAAEAPPAAAAPAGAGLKACSNCGREIPGDYLVCPFCGAVTR